MFYIIIWTLIVFSTYFSVGQILNKKFFSNELTIVQTIILGIITMTTLAGIVQIFVPINYWFTIVILLVSLLINRKGFNRLLVLKEYLNFSKLSRIKILLLLLLVLLAYLLLFASGDLTNGDTYLYHNQNIKWFNEFRLVPGLANLHGRFGFNSNTFILIASQVLPTKPTFYIFNFGLTLLFLVYFLKNFLWRDKFRIPYLFFFFLYDMDAKD